MTQTLAPATAAERVAAVPLIPREHLYGNPTRAGGRISPDGKWLSWMAPHEGVMNVWMAPASAPEDARLMTRSDDRPIPVHLEYRTAFTNVRGGLQFRRDIYGRDGQIWSALEAEGVEAGPLPA